MKINSLRISVIISLVIFCVSTTAIAQPAKFPDATKMDKSIKPGDNFYMYVNGSWEKNTKMPPTEVVIGSGLDVFNKAKEHIHSILLELSKTKNAPGTIEQKIGDFFISGMDTATIEKRGYDPIKPMLAQIDAIQNSHDVMQFVAQQTTQGNNLLIQTGVGSDEKNSTMNIAIFAQGGLGLPERDYYFRTDSSTLQLVEAYKTYMQQLFMLTGDDATTATKKSVAIYDFEKQLAASHRTAVELRDPQTNYNKMLVADLDKSMPQFEWKQTLATLGAATDSINLQQPGFYKKVDTLLKRIPIDTWKYYLAFHTTENYARLLSMPFVNTRFNYIKKLYGQKKMKPRWERIAYTMDDELGYALGKIYVEKYFTPEAKQKMLTLVNNLQKAFEIRISKLDWMSDETKKNRYR